MIFGGEDDVWVDAEVAEIEGSCRAGLDVGRREGEGRTRAVKDELGRGVREEVLETELRKETEIGDTNAMTRRRRGRQAAMHRETWTSAGAREWRLPRFELNIGAGTNRASRIVHREQRIVQPDLVGCH